MLFRDYQTKNLLNMVLMVSNLDVSNVRITLTEKTIKKQEIGMDHYPSYRFFAISPPKMGEVFFLRSLRSWDMWRFGALRGWVFSPRVREGKKGKSPRGL